MITNILAAVAITLVTNVVQTDNSSGCSMHQPGVIPLVYGHNCTPYVPATERRLTTNVTELTTVKLTIAGEEKSFESQRLISSVTAVLRRLDEWKPAEIKTNSIAKAGTFSRADSIIVGNGQLLLVQ
jgi:hypothetical protein